MLCYVPVLIVNCIKMTLKLITMKLLVACLGPARNVSLALRLDYISTVGPPDLNDLKQQCTDIAAVWTSIGKPPAVVK